MFTDLYLDATLGKHCTPEVKLAESDATLSDAKGLCANDLTCNQFYRSGFTGKYYKCLPKSIITESDPNNMLITKGIMY